MSIRLTLPSLNHQWGTKMGRECLLYPGDVFFWFCNPEDFYCNTRLVFIIICVKALLPFSKSSTYFQSSLESVSQASWYFLPTLAKYCNGMEVLDKNYLNIIKAHEKTLLFSCFSHMLFYYPTFVHFLFLKP